MEIETVVKNLLTNKSPGPNGFIDEFYQKIREELTFTLLKLLSTCRGRHTYNVIIWSITLISKPNKAVTKKKITGQFH